MPRKKELDPYVTALRAPLGPALTAEALVLLRSPANISNGCNYRDASTLEDAQWRVGLSYYKARLASFSMSPVWLEEWEMSVICRALNIVCLEIHSACSSNQGRSHFQIITPTPDHTLGSKDVVIVVRRIQCHYNPVWINNRLKSKLGELPGPFRALFFPEVAL